MSTSLLDRVPYLSYCTDAVSVETENGIRATTLMNKPKRVVYTYKDAGGVFELISTSACKNG